MTGNVPSDWGAYRRRCETCGEMYHCSEARGACPGCEERHEREAERLATGDGCFGGEPMTCWTDGCGGWDGKYQLNDGIVVVRCECGDSSRAGCTDE